MDAGLFRSTQSAIVEIHRRLTNYETNSEDALFYAQSLRSEISPKQWIPAEQSPPGAPEILTGCASQEGSRRLLRSQPRRLGFGQPHQARPRRSYANIPWGWKVNLETGTFYLAESRNFLFGSDIELLFLFPP